MSDDANGNPVQLPTTGTPVYQSNEVRGIPMACCEDDGRETSVPVMDASHRRAYHPVAAAEGQQENSTEHHHQQQQRPLSAAASVSSDGAPSTVGRGSAGVSVDARDRAAGRSHIAPGRPTGQYGMKGEGSGVDTPATAKRTSGSCGDSNINREGNAAAAAYDSVVKPIFSPFQQLRAQQEQQSQPANSQHSYWNSGNDGAAPASSLYPQQTNYGYALTYGQPQYSQPNSAYGMSPQYSSYVDASQLQPNTTAAAVVGGYPAPVYLQQLSYPMPMPLPPPDAAIEEAQRLSQSPEWNTGLFGLNLDPLSSIDAFICGYCISSAHFNVVYREEQGLYAPLIAGLLCVDCCCATQTLPYAYPWCALAVHTFVIRREMRRRYHIAGNPLIVKKGRAAQEVTVEGAAEANTSADAPTRGEAAAAGSVPSAPECPAPTTDAAQHPPPAARVDTGAEQLLTSTRQSAVVSQLQRTVQSLRKTDWPDCVADLLTSVFCTPCAMAQHHRETSLRGEWPGKVVFSRKCFCGERNQESEGLPMTNMF